MPKDDKMTADPAALMAFIAGARPDESADKRSVRMAPLGDDVDPNKVKEIGGVLEFALADLRRAYPKSTRQKYFTNEEWRRHGFDWVADENEKLGLSGR